MTQNLISNDLSRFPSHFKITMVTSDHSSTKWFLKLLLLKQGSCQIAYLHFCVTLQNLSKGFLCSRFQNKIKWNDPYFLLFQTWVIHLFLKPSLLSNFPNVLIYLLYEDHRHWKLNLNIILIYYQIPMARSLPTHTPLIYLKCYHSVYSWITQVENLLNLLLHFYTPKSIL